MAGPCTITTTVTVKVTITNIERSTRSTICAICCHSALTTSRLSCSFWRLSLFSIVEHTFCNTWRNWCSNLSKSGKCDNGKLSCKVHGIRPFCLGISLFTQYFDEGWISSLFLASCKIKCYHGYLLTIFFLAMSLIQHYTFSYLTQWISYKKQELLTLRDHLGWSSVTVGVRIAHHFSVLCSVVFVFVLCLVHPMLPVFLDCPFMIAPSVFSNVYFRNLWLHWQHILCGCSHVSLFDFSKYVWYYI